MNRLRSIFTAGFFSAALTSASIALTLPVSEDTSTTAIQAVARGAGKAPTLSVSARRNGLVCFEAGAFANTVPPASVTSARLIFYVCKVTQPGPMTVHRVTQGWTETFTSGPVNVPNFDLAPLATVAVAAKLAKQFVIVDVTATVKGWLTDPASDFGFAIVSSGGVASVQLGSKEGPALGYPATLEIETGPMATGAVGSSLLAPNLHLEGTTTGVFSGNLAGTASSANSVGGVNASDVAAAATLANAATNVNAAGTIVQRDANGNFSAGAVNASMFTGNGAGLTNVTAVNGVAATSLANLNTAFMEFVRVANPGNANDSVDGDINTPGTQRLGAVAATFLIGKYEVTNAQYAQFLNAVAATNPISLYHPLMGTDPRGGIAQSGTDGSFTYAVRPNMGNKPVIFIRFGDAVRFCNWMHNGMPKGEQGPATTEDGAYLMITESYPDAVITRKPGARVFLPTENQWYKAAFYDPTKGGTGGYYVYSTRSDTVPEVATVDATGNINNPSSNVANYNGGGRWDGQAGNLTSVGSGGPGNESAYGVADMAGNVFEWNETLFIDGVRGLRGGAWGSWVGQSNDLQSSGRYGGEPDVEQDNIGFRVARP